MRTRLRTVLAIACVALFAVPQSSFAGTVTGKANGSSPKIYVFTADDSGQVLLTLTWQKSSADLFMLVLDTDADPLVWCIGAALQSRTQRCDFGALGGLQYVIGVQSFNSSTKFQLNVQSSGSETVFRNAGLRELSPADPEYGRLSRHLATAAGRLR